MFNYKIQKTYISNLPSTCFTPGNKYWVFESDAQPDHYIVRDNDGDDVYAWKLDFK